MDRVFNALKCVNCREILSTPVILPCGHTICQKHTQVDDDKVICSECGIQHENKGFVVSKSVTEMINAQLAALDFGPQHKKTNESCDQLKNLIEKSDCLLNDLDYHINEEIGMLKYRIVLRSEELKKQINEITQEMLDGLERYEVECKTNCEENVKETDFRSLMDKLKEKNEDAKKKLSEWSSVLNELKVNEQKWKNIQEDCEETIKHLTNNLSNVEIEMFMNKLDEKKFNILNFEETNMELILKNKVINLKKIIEIKI